jgi:hypothetical protein
MTRLPVPLARALRLPPSPAGDPVKRITVHPDQVVQRDPRAWSQTSLEQVVIRFLLISCLVVALGAGSLALALRFAT